MNGGGEEYNNATYPSSIYLVKKNPKEFTSYGLIRSQQYKVPIIGCNIGSNLVTPKCPGATNPKGDSI